MEWDRRVQNLWILAKSVIFFISRQTPLEIHQQIQGVPPRNSVMEISNQTIDSWNMLEQLYSRGWKNFPSEIRLLPTRRDWTDRFCLREPSVGWIMRNSFLNPSTKQTVIVGHESSFSQLKPYFPQLPFSNQTWFVRKSIIAIKMSL